MSENNDLFKDLYLGLIEECFELKLPISLDNYRDYLKNVSPVDNPIWYEIQDYVLRKEG